MDLNKIIATLVAIVVALLSWNLYTTHMLVVQVSVIEERTKGVNLSLLESRLTEYDRRLNQLERQVVRTNGNN